MSTIVNENIIDFYDCTQKHILGKGAFGKVFSIDKNNVLKQYEINDDWAARNCLMEILILRNISHLNIIKCESIYINKNLNIFQIVLEKCDLNLENLIITRRFQQVGFTLSEIKFILFQIFSGIAYLNSYNLIHCDIKPQNILIKDNVIKIIDFGLTDFDREFKLKNFNSESDHIVYTDNYASPEVLNNNYFSKKTDTWAIGCIIFELLSYKILFSGISSKNHRNEIKEKVNNFMKLNAIDKNKFLTEKIISNNDNEIFNLLITCLLNYEIRPISEEIINFKIFNEVRTDDNIIDYSEKKYNDYKTFFIENSCSLEKYCDKLQDLVFENEIINILLSFN